MDFALYCSGIFEVYMFRELNVYVAYNQIMHSQHMMACVNSLYK